MQIYDNFIKHTNRLHNQQNKNFTKFKKYNNSKAF